MPRRTQRRREIERLFALRESEGLSLRALAERSGIPLGTLSWWSHQLRRGSAERPFTEVSIVDFEPDATEDATLPPPDIVLRHPDGVSVEFRGRVAERVVDRVLLGLARWC